MRNLIKRIIHPLLKTWLRIYYLKPRKFSYKDIVVIVHKEVFPPHLTLSTTVFIDFLESQDIRGKSLLELGCGTGLISIFAASREVRVTATDINRTALEYLKKSAQLNKVSLSIRYSDLFNELTDEQFDFIIINPPYYPKNPSNVKEKAWFCGANFEYFHQLFHQLPAQLRNNNRCFMILSEDCKIKDIKALAAKNGIRFSLAHTQKKSGEENYIFSLTRT